jgi:uncharacterized RDD family membrane protein YckC
VYCSKCGATLAADAAFCIACGTPAGSTGIVPASPGAANPSALPASPPAYPTGVARVPYADPAGLTVSRGFTYAGFWLRVVAYFIDGLIINLALLVLIVPLIFLTGIAANFRALTQNHGQPDPAVIGGFIMILLLLSVLIVIALWLYHAYLESGEKQATYGKQAMGIYVTDLMGDRVTFGRASGRFFAKMVTGMIPLGIGYAMAGFTERRQTLHDMIASCLVLRR